MWDVTGVVWVNVFLLLAHEFKLQRAKFSLDAEWKWLHYQSPPTLPWKNNNLALSLPPHLEGSRNVGSSWVTEAMTVELFKQPPSLRNWSNRRTSISVKCTGHPHQNIPFPKPKISKSTDSRFLLLSLFHKCIMHTFCTISVALFNYSTLLHIACIAKYCAPCTRNIVCKSCRAIIIPESPSQNVSNKCLLTWKDLKLRPTLKDLMKWHFH